MESGMEYEGAYNKYAGGEEGGLLADGMAAVEAARTIKEAMQVYFIADCTVGHASCCEAAFAKALALSVTKTDLDLILDYLNGDRRLTSYRHEMMRVFEKADTLGLAIEQAGIKK